MALAANFLGGAKSRLLPASVPFRYFGAALGFHALAWLLVIAGAAPLTSFAGGLGWPLAALHALTLGVLAMTAMGASLQLLPVATRQAVHSARAPALLWWGFAPGVALLVAGMAHAWPALLGLGAALVAACLLAYAALLGRNLRGARGMPVVVAHGWAALACLVLLLASALALVATWLGWPLLARTQALAWHLPFAAYGFMGLLVMGFSHILVPMFALAEAPAPRPSMASLGLALGALACAAVAALAEAGTVLATGLGTVGPLLGLAGWGLHVALMRRALRSGMRRDLGRPFVLVHAGWALLAASLLAAAALPWAAAAPAGPLAWPRLPTLFGALLMLGLLTFLLGILARILPFLASMHAPAGRRGPPMPSTLTAERPLAVHFHAHAAAVALLLLAIALDNAWLARAAGLAGLVGAVALLQFFRFAWQRMRGAQAATAAGDARAAAAPRPVAAPRTLKAPPPSAEGAGAAESAAAGPPAGVGPAGPAPVPAEPPDLR